jgi:hypothetical protein
MSDLERTLRLLYTDGDVVEFRILDAGEPDRTLSGYFAYRNLYSAIRKINSWDGTASGIYTVLNPVDERLLARSANRLKKTRRATSDADVPIRRWLLVDIDVIRPSGICATDPEHDAALALASEVRQSLASEGWPLPISVDSGNGAHLLYRLPDLRNDPGNAGLLKNVLAVLERRFQRPLVAIDSQTFNASRLVRMPGTTNAKGDSIDERPWRRARLLMEESESIRIEPVPIAVLQALGETVNGGRTQELNKDRNHVPGNSSIETFARRHGLEVKNSVTLSDGTFKLVLTSCPFGGDAHKDSAIFEGPDGRRGFHCFHKSCSGFHWAELRSKLEPEGSEEQDPVTGAEATASGEGGSDAPWPEPQPLEPELPPVPQFDADLLLPSPLREWVVDVSARMQVVADLPAAALLTGLAACIGRRAQILPKALDDTFVVIPLMWALLIAKAGSMKTPTLLSALQPLHLAERVWRDEYRVQSEAYAKAVNIYDAQLAAWKEQAKAAAKNGAEPKAQPEKPEPPVARRVIVNHTSFEALQLALAQNRYGLLEVRDEASSWLSELDTPANASIRGLYLQAWTGREDYVIDRIGRGTIVARDVCLSVIGGITPERLHRYVADVYAGVAPDDGLLQRFGLAVEPDPPTPFEYTDRRPDAQAMERIFNLFTSLLALQPESPYTFRFTGEAQELYVEWLTKLENLIRGNGIASPLASHLAKHRSLMPGLSLLFEIASRIIGSGPGFSLDPASTRVTLASAKLGAFWCDSYLQPHARRIYARQAASAVPARELGRRILAREIGESGVVNIRDVGRRQLSGLPDSTTVREAILVLSAHGWLLPAKRTAGLQGGRPAENWEVNPRLWENGRSALQLIPGI